MHHSSLTRSLAVYVLPIIFVIGLFAYLITTAEPATKEDQKSSPDILAACIEHTNVSLHIHPELTIMVNGEKQEIPANIGITESCMHPVHTHDASGKIHLEYLYPVDFSLGDFFTVWGKEFSSANLMGLHVDETHIIRVTVNGQPSEEYERLVLKDSQKIVISYEELATE